MRKLLLLILLVSKSMYCQLGISNTVNMPTVVPPSPEAASIAKYVDMKINEYRGMVQQQIPIYHIADGAINLPISLNYQSGGFKVIESSSSIGLGWSLNAGGVITRSMNGVPDDEQGLAEGFLTLSSQVEYNYLNGGTDARRYRILQSMGQGCKDAQPDIFNFNFNGYSGKFHFDWDGNIIIASESEISITPIQDIPNKPTITGWIIETPDGFTYTFETIETTRNIGSSTNICYLAQQGFASSWYLSEIADPYNQRKLFFEYDSYRIRDFNIHTSQSRIHKTGGSSNCGGSISGIRTFSRTNIDIQGRILKRVYSNTSPVEVLFIPSTNKVMDTSDDFYALSEIQIRNRIQDDLIKKYVLDHNYSTGRLSLVSVQEFGSSSTSLPPYEFIYYDALPERNSTRKDHWGYTNNNSGTDMVPSYFIPITANNTANYGTADRTPSFEGSKRGVLHKIIYPTGGYDEYTFEQNTYGKVGGVQVNEYVRATVGKNVGAIGTSGFGCASNGTTVDTDNFTVNINPETNDPREKIAIKIIGSVQKYTQDYFGMGLGPKVRILNDKGEIVLAITLASNNNVNRSILLTPGDYTMIAEATWRDCNSNAKDRASLSVAYQNYTSDRLYEKPIGGVRVKSIQKYDTSNRLLLAQEYEYKDANGYSSGSIHKEPNYIFDQDSFIFVAGNQAGGVNYGCNYIVALDSDRSNLGMSTGGHIGYRTVTIRQKSENETNGSTILNFTGGTNIVYDELPFPPPLDYSFSAGKITSIQLKNASNDLIKQTNNTYQNKESLTYAMKVRFKGGALMGVLEELFNIKRYFVRMDHLKLRTQEVKTFLNDDEQTITTEYEYTDTLRKLKEKKVFHDKGIDREVLYYPENYNELTGLSTADETSYASLSNNYRISQPIQTNIYHEDTYGTEKLLQKQRTIYRSSNNTSNNLAPIQIETAKSNNDLETKIQYHKYDAYGNPLEVSKANGMHMVYIWGYNHQYPIAKIENATYDQVSLYAANIQLRANQDNDRTMGYDGKEGVLRKALDLLRSQLPDAMITTYTYDPLIGVTSVKDPRGYTMYYEYDDLNRLHKVKDATGNIISKNQYNYKNK